MRPPSLLLLAILLGTSLPASLGDKVDVKVGFSPSGLFPSNLGLPIFVNGEELWVQSDQIKRTLLLAPDGRIVTSQGPSRGPVMLYRFTALDWAGVWGLRLESSGGFINLPLILEYPSPEVRDLKVDYRLEEGRLLLEGSLRFGPSVLRDRASFVLTESTTKAGPVDRVLNFTLGERGVGVKVWRERDRILFAPYLIIAEEETNPQLGSQLFELIAWAEVLQEAPLVRFVDRGEVITMLEEPVARSRPRRLFIGLETNAAANLDVPPVNVVGDGGRMPLRWGPATLRLYLQEGQTIHLSSFRIVFLPGGGGLESIGTFEVKPVPDMVGFSFSDGLEAITSYELGVVTSIRGLNQVWNINLRPALAGIKVVSAGSGEKMVDYRLTLTAATSTTNSNWDSFALLRGERVVTGYTLELNGIPVDSAQMSPTLLELVAGNTDTISVAASRVSFKVLDLEDRPVEEGVLSIERVDPQGAGVRVSRSWSYSQTPSLFLPAGLYRAVAKAGGVEEDALFQVGLTDGEVVIRLEGLGPKLDMLFFSSGLAIIVLEVLLAYRVWRRAWRLRA